MAKPILKQVLEGLEYLHAQNIYHRGNILVETDGLEEGIYIG